MMGTEKGKKNIIKPMVVAEHCCNHKGSVDTAMQMIKEASLAGADYAKFQKWYPKESLTDEHYNSPHPDMAQSFGEPYGIHRENLEFDVSIHKDLQKYCEEVGIGYSSSAFDMTSLKQIITLNPDYIKIPSQKNTVLDFYPVLADEFDGDVHVSTGMTSDAEINIILEHLDKNNLLERTVLYSATSCYPCPHDQIHLLRISKFCDLYGDLVKAIGFSGHHNGIAPDIAALALGARYFERHFTLDRTMKGTDQAASLEPQGLMKLCRDLVNVDLGLTNRPDGILDSEMHNYKKVKSGEGKLI